MLFLVGAERTFSTLCCLAVRHLHARQQLGATRGFAAAVSCAAAGHQYVSLRLRWVSYLVLSLLMHLTVYCYWDRSGCSEGEYVSLGYFEKDDLQVSDLILTCLSWLTQA